jgi:hypothetical protein
VSGRSCPLLHFRCEFQCWAISSWAVFGHSPCESCLTGTSRNKPDPLANPSLTAPVKRSHRMELDAHKSAVARAYGLASDGYTSPPLDFSPKAQRAWSISPTSHPDKRSWTLPPEPAMQLFTPGPKLVLGDQWLASILPNRWSISLMRMLVRCRRQTCDSH